MWDEIAKLDPNLAVFGVKTMHEHVDKSLLLPQICATLLGIFGAVGLTLAAIGLYRVMSYSVRRRTREIGIRMALGGRPSTVLAMVVRQGLALTGIGLAIGLAIAARIGRLSATLLYGISGTDRDVPSRSDRSRCCCVGGDCDPCPSGRPSRSSSCPSQRIGSTVVKTGSKSAP